VDAADQGSRAPRNFVSAFYVSNVELQYLFEPGAPSEVVRATSRALPTDEKSLFICAWPGYQGKSHP
jgi:hypothetical protein